MAMTGQQIADNQVQEKMKNAPWIVMFAIAVGCNIFKFKSVAYAVGATIPLLVLSLTVSGLWWGIQKLRKKELGVTRWLNIAAGINLVLICLSFFVHNAMKSRGF